MDVPVDEIDNLDISQLQGSSPEDIAQSLFTQDPRDPNSCQIVTDQNDIDVTYLYEILITILLEGLEILSSGIDTVDLNTFTSDHITSLNPWLKSIGYKVKVVEKDAQDYDQYQEYYCRVVVRSPTTQTWFDMRHIDKNYSFNLNGTYLEENKEKQNLRDLYSIFRCGAKTYVVSFDFN